MTPYIIQSGDAFVGPSRIAQRSIAPAAVAAAAGLTEVATATVSGGAVSSLSITVNLEAGKSYRLGCGVLASSTTYSTTRFNINSDDNSANYLCGIMQSDGTIIDAANIPLMAAQVSSICTSFGSVGLLDNTPYMAYTQTLEHSAERGQAWGLYNNSETTVSTIRLFRTNAGLDNGTWITCWRLD